MTDAIVDWESIVHKNVRSKEGEGAGNVDVILGDKIPGKGVQWSRSFVKRYIR
jgi:hypothetical protein